MSTDSLSVASTAAMNIAYTEANMGYQQGYKDMQPSKTPETILATLEKNYAQAVNAMLDNLQFHGATETGALSSLAARLDYGHYYARQGMMTGVEMESGMKKKPSSMLQGRSAGLRAEEEEEEDLFMDALDLNLQDV